MRGILYRRFGAFWLGFIPGLVWSASSAPDAYLVQPSTKTVHQRQAILALGQTKDASAGPQLLEALSSKDPMSRALAAQGLGTIKYTAARPPLSDLLASDPSPQVRLAAAVSLRQIGDPQAVEALGKALKDSELNVRLEALSGLGRFLEPRSRPMVEAACKDASVEVRRTAVYILGQLHDPASVPLIQQLLKDSDRGVKTGAAEALGEFRTVDSKAALAPLLKDPDKAVQASAARSLLMIGDNTGFETAKALSSDSDLRVSLIAIDGLGWSKDPAAEAELKGLLAQPSVNNRPAIEQAIFRTQQLKKQ